jgi:hypothetical protein
MKKITLSVAALSLAISGFSTNPPTSKQLVKEISITTEDMIQSMRMTNDTVTRCYSFVEMSEIYVHNLLDMLSKLEDIQMNLCKDFECPNYREQIYKQTEVENRCENCDEID